MQKELQLIKDIIYIEDDFSHILSLNNCVIYSDPPYINTKKYSNIPHHPSHFVHISEDDQYIDKPSRRL